MCIIDIYDIYKGQVPRCLGLADWVTFTFLSWPVSHDDVPCTGLGNLKSSTVRGPSSAGSFTDLLAQHIERNMPVLKV